MKENNIFVTIGYSLAIICFLLSMFFRINPQSEYANGFLGMGGFLLFVTSICKFIIDKKINRK